jgi:hypothetical protein
MKYEPYHYQQYCTERIITDAALGLFLDMCREKVKGALING